MKTHSLVGVNFVKILCSDVHHLEQHTQSHIVILISLFFMYKLYKAAQLNLHKLIVIWFKVLCFFHVVRGNYSLSMRTTSSLKLSTVHFYIHMCWFVRFDLQCTPVWSWAASTFTSEMTSHAHLVVAGIGIVTDVQWENGTDQHFHLFGVNVGGLTRIPLAHADPVKHLE